MKCMIIGNKIDLKDERKVEAKSLGIPIIETSAFDATNVKEDFYDLLKEMYKVIRKKLDIVESQAESGKDVVKLDTTKEKKRKVVLI